MVAGVAYMEDILVLAAVGMDRGVAIPPVVTVLSISRVGSQELGQAFGRVATDP